MPFTTLLAAVKLGLSNPVENPSCPGKSRLSKATSDGEFARVGTWPLGGTVESLGKTR
jgi:hypothetical protein